MLNSRLRTLMARDCCGLARPRGRGRIFVCMHARMYVCMSLCMHVVCMYVCLFIVLFQKQTSYTFGKGHAGPAVINNNREM